MLQTVLERASILAHRGWFKNPSEKNSTVSLSRAIDEGFGIETDIRDHNGRIVISHDPPTDTTNHTTIDWLLESIKKANRHGRHAINVKADGLANQLTDAILRSGLDKETFFAFDMSVPDALAYIKAGFPVYSRISELEIAPSFLDDCKGVWVDSFTGHFPQVKMAEDLIQKGIRAALVSPELHNREHSALWEEIKEAELHKSSLFELCTDHPDQAFTFFGGV